MQVSNKKGFKGPGAKPACRQAGIQVIELFYLNPQTLFFGVISDI